MLDVNEVTNLPRKQGLYDPAYEKDSCGVGFIVNIEGKTSNKVLQDARTMLNRLEHRGAAANDNTGDGAGVLTSMPHKFFSDILKKEGAELPSPGNYAVAVIFMPKDNPSAVETEFERISGLYNLKILHWRVVPVNSDIIGAVAREREPIIKQFNEGKTKSICLVNGDKKQWVDSNQAPLPTPKREIHGKKAMLCVWWDQKGIIYYELLEPKQTITADLYSQQLIRLSHALETKRSHRAKGERKVIILHDNSRPHVAKTTRSTIENLGWEVLSHPAYSPDLAPSDYHLFRSMQNFLSEKNYLDLEEIKKDISQYFTSKPASFYELGIKMLPERWELCISSEGNYFSD